MTTINVQPTNSVGIQRALDKTGTGKTYTEAHFLHGIYPISTRLYLNSGTKITCAPGTYWQLAPNTNFGVQIPILGQRTTAIYGLDISGINYFGNHLKQTTTPSDHGTGYGNFIGLRNVTQSKFHNLNIHDTEGDGFRIETGANLEFFSNLGAAYGHDYVHLNKCSSCKIYNNNITMRAGNVVRTRTSKYIEVYKNICKGTKTDYGPAFQIENLVGSSSNISVHDNLITDTLGPGIELIAAVLDSRDVKIYNNQIYRCGQMPKANKLPNVGGISCNGWDKVIIENNKIDSCLGLGIGFAKYIGGSTVGRTAIVKNNAITNTRKALYPGIASGTGIANLLNYKLTVSGNKLAKNVRDYYGV